MAISEDMIANCHALTYCSSVIIVRKLWDNKAQESYFEVLKLFCLGENL
jgi:hypothetical protein